MIPHTEGSGGGFWYNSDTKEREREENPLFILFYPKTALQQAFKPCMLHTGHTCLNPTYVMNFAALPRSDSAAFLLLQENGWHDSDVEPPARLPDQVQAAYGMLRNGYTEVEVRLAIQEQFGKKAQATRAFKRGLDLVIQEQRAAREHLPELVMAVRWNAIQKAIQGGQLGAAAAMLRDVGAACGEAALDAASATLLVEVLPRGGSEAPVEPSEPIQEPPASGRRRRGALAGS
jgi:hypothetical protein